MRFIVLSAAIFGAAFAAIAYAQSQRQTSGPSRYAIVISTEGSTAWRLDTVSGGMMYCLTALKGNPLAADSARSAGCTLVAQ